MVTSPLLLAPDPQTIDFLKACDNFYSKMNRERKYKGKDNDKDNDKKKTMTKTKTPKE